MSEVVIEKDVFVRDRYGVRRRAYVAGQKVDQRVYDAVMRESTPVEPEASGEKVMVRGMETKILPVEEEVEEAKPVQKVKAKARSRKKK